MKPKYLKIRLRPHFYLFPFIRAEHNLAVDFGREEDAMLFSRQQAAKMLLRLRSWGEKAYTKPTTHAML